MGPESEGRRRGPSRGFLVTLGVIAVAFGVVVLVGRHEGRDGLTMQLPGGRPITLVDEPLYPAHDPWRPYLADERTCPGGEDADAPLIAQLETMVCLIDHARAQRGLRALPISGVLSRSARFKGDDIQRCETFAHSPCGGDPSAVAAKAGYEGTFGENLYIGDGRLGAPRPALDGWLNSPSHRENLLRPEWRVQSLYVAKIERFRAHRNATLWVSHFGDR